MEKHEDYVIGVDVGGTKICISSITRDGRMIDTERFPTCLTSLNDSIEHILNSIDTFFSIHKYPALPLRMGIGLRGLIDKKHGIWQSTSIIPDFKPVDLRAKITEKFAIKTIIDNDVHAATLAEKYYGIGTKYDSFIYLNIGTGIAAGIVNEGRMIAGSSNCAGEFGHTVIELEGDPCRCGLAGCIEPIASGKGLVDQARRLLYQYPDSVLKQADHEHRLYSSTIFKAYDDGDELARIVGDKAIKTLGIGIINLINLLNPQAVVLGGGVISDGWMLPRLKEYIDLYSSRNIFQSLKEFKISSLGSDYVGVLGAACLGWEDLK